MAAKDILDIFNRDFAVGFLTPRKEKGARVLLDFWIEKTLNIPSTRCIVMTVFVTLAAKSIARIERFPVIVEIQMIATNKVFQIRITEEIFWIVKLKIIHSQLVWIGHIGVIWHTASYPMMSADCLQPPNFIHVRKGNPV